MDNISTGPLVQSATRFPVQAQGFGNEALNLDGEDRSVWEETQFFQLKRRHFALEMSGDQEHLTLNDRPQSRGSPEGTTLNNNTLLGPRSPRKRRMFDEESSSNRRLSMGDLPHYFQQVKAGDNHESLTEKYLLGRAEIPRRPENSETLGEEPYIRITQVAPSNSSIIDAIDDNDNNKNWKISLERFSSKKQSDNFKTMPKRMKSYYKAQNKLIASYEETFLLENESPHQIDQDSNTDLKKKASLFARITLLVNVCLTIAKAIAVALSGSISITSSLVDSCVDLISGAIFWWTTRAMKRRNPYNYPQGRTKLEPIAIIILSVIMSLAALQLIQESISKIVELTGKKTGVPSVDLPTIGIALGTIVIKLTLYLVCRRVSSSTVQALAMDHRNDVLSNAVAIIFGYIGSHQMFEKTGKTELSYLDPIGAILISIYIMVNWWKTGYGQIKLLTGYTAKPMFLSKLTWICLNHDNNVKQIDTVRAFYFGNNFLVEVDIVLPEEMSLKQAHDIGESLQQKLERLPEVERAFVHLDYECTHDPLSEHKMV